MTLLHLGESVFTAANDKNTHKPESWCRYSATCYKVRTPMHTVTPLNGKQYTDGCPRDESACVSAQIVNGNSPYKATDETSAQKPNSGSAGRAANAVGGSM